MRKIVGVDFEQNTIWFNTFSLDKSYSSHNGFFLSITNSIFSGDDAIESKLPPAAALQQSKRRKWSLNVKLILKFHNTIGGF